MGWPPQAHSPQICDIPFDKDKGTRPIRKFHFLSDGSNYKAKTMTFQMLASEAAVGTRIIISKFYHQYKLLQLYYYYISIESYEVTNGN